MKMFLSLIRVFNFTKKNVRSDATQLDYFQYNSSLTPREYHASFSRSTFFIHIFYALRCLNTLNSWLYSFFKLKPSSLSETPEMFFILEKKYLERNNLLNKTSFFIFLNIVTNAISVKTWRRRGKKKKYNFL